jgi:hypothetical protein
LLHDESWRDSYDAWKLATPPEAECDAIGLCVAPAGATSITNCIYCGKELHERDGAWWTWDAQERVSRRPQLQEFKRPPAEPIDDEVPF